MTTLVAWIGVDSRAPASAYIATDSRISWPVQKWDLGCKTFSSSDSPDIFGYCGDVIFPSLLLYQFCAGLDSGLYAGDSRRRFNALCQLVRHSHASWPSSERRPFQIVHCSRDGMGMGATFNTGIISFDSGVGFKVKHLAEPKVSSVIHLTGTGRKTTASQLRRWQVAAEKETT